MPAAQGARNASPRTQRKRPGDLTGVRGQQLAAEAAANKAEAVKQVEEAREAERKEKLATVVDYTGQQTEEPAVVEETEVEVKPKTRRIRVNYPIDEMTFGKEVLSEGKYDENGVMVEAPRIGALRKYSFEENVYYEVPADVADHLAFLGYIWE